MNAVVHAVCNQCREAKPPEGFYANRGGKHTTCKKCRNKGRVESRERHRNRYLARAAVNNAIQSGSLIRQTCETCGSAETQAHHDDYRRPLYVRWLCRTHHMEWHRHNTPKE